MTKNERINIKLIGSNNSNDPQVELPLNIMILAKFGGKNNYSYKINFKNINQVMMNISPELNFVVPNVIMKRDKNNLNVNLAFHGLEDFRPEKIALKIPELRAMIGLRNIIKAMRDKVYLARNYQHDMLEVINSSQGA